MSFEDSNIEGKIGEQLYIDYLKNYNINFIDVTEDVECQQLDIDFIIPKGNHTKEEILKEVRHAHPNTRAQRQKNIGYTVEVKLDKVTHNRYLKNSGELSYGTGNLVYEIISHNMPGCLARSYADFIFYVCVDTFEEVTQLSKAYMINLFKWRQALIDSGKNNSLGCFLKPLKYIKENNQLVEENVLNILCPVEKLKKVPDVVIDYTDKVKEFFPKDVKLIK